MLDAEQYLKDSGQKCPSCHLYGVWHDGENLLHEVVSNVRVIFMPCWCTRCNTKWVETYRLAGAHFGLTDAIASAQHTYKPPSSS